MEIGYMLLGTLDMEGKGARFIITLDTHPISFSTVNTV